VYLIVALLSGPPVPSKSAHIGLLTRPPVLVHLASLVLLFMGSTLSRENIVSSTHYPKHRIVDSESFDKMVASGQIAKATFGAGA